MDSENEQEKSVDPTLPDVGVDTPAQAAADEHLAYAKAQHAQYMRLEALKLAGGNVEAAKGLHDFIINGG
jgi:hypothetical protein